MKITKNGVTYSSALFFLGGGIITYYLSARYFEFAKIASTNLLLSKTAAWAREQGFKNFNFGGGSSSDQHNSLFKFKTNFAKYTVPFFIGKRIHNMEVYEELRSRYIDQHGAEVYEQVKHFLQFYRFY